LARTGGNGSTHRVFASSGQTVWKGAPIAGAAEKIEPGLFLRTEGLPEEGFPRRMTSSARMGGAGEEALPRRQKAGDRGAL